MSIRESTALAENGVKKIIVNMLLTVNTSIKPIIMVVRGATIGICFTLTAHSTFLYDSPEARYMTPFMKSA
jgi:enoyl-CoA hydratase/carnithine racemase